MSDKVTMAELLRLLLDGKRKVTFDPTEARAVMHAAGLCLDHEYSAFRLDGSELVPHFSLGLIEEEDEPKDLPHTWTRDAPTSRVSYVPGGGLALVMFSRLVCRQSHAVGGRDFTVDGGS